MRGPVVITKVRNEKNESVEVRAEDVMMEAEVRDLRAFSAGLKMGGPMTLQGM